jgi:hypothetical protein
MVILLEGNNTNVNKQWKSSKTNEGNYDIQWQSLYTKVKLGASNWSVN